MAIKETGIAARAKETPAKSADELLREARQAQKFMGISKDDNASTTGRLVNPPAAVIPNPNGAGGEAGATGFFGANLLGARVGGGTNQTSTRYNPLSNNQNNFTPAGNGGFGVGIVRQDISGLSALEQSRIMYGDTAASGFGKLSYGFNKNQQNYTPNLNTSRTNPYGIVPEQRQPTNTPPVVKAGGTKPATPPSYTNTIGGDKQSRLNSTPNTPPAWGTAGLYTYGQFSNKEDAFLTLMDKVSSYENAAGTSAGLTIPATIAQNLGLTEALQTPGSGWSLVNGAWVNDGSTPVTGGTDYSNVGTTDFTSTDFYKNYAANNVSFENQLRYDPATGRYISVGAWMQKKNDKQGYLTRGDREAKLRQKREGAKKMSWSEIQGSYEINNYYQPVEQTPSPFTGSWGVVNFNTGSG